jgi:hypothetical protein
MVETNESRQHWMLMQHAMVFASIIFVVIAVAATGAIASEASRGSSGVSTATNQIDVSLTESAIQAPSAARGGEITFHVTNNGTSNHEMLVLQTDMPAGMIPLTEGGEPPMPVTSGADRVAEDTSVGETGGDPLVPGEQRLFTLDLAPGHYVLICNIAGHYANGMHRAFTVL